MYVSAATATDISGPNRTWFVFISVLIFFVLLLIVGGCVLYCVFRRRRKRWMGRSPRDLIDPSTSGNKELHHVPPFTDSLSDYRNECTDGSGSGT